MALPNVCTNHENILVILIQNITFSKVAIDEIYYDRLEFEYDNFFFQVRCSFHIDFVALSFVLVSWKTVSKPSLGTVGNRFG